MKQRIGNIALVVKDYDEAIEIYTQKLDFRLVEDTKLNEEKRWVLVAPPGGETSLVLAKSSNEKQAQAIGNQTGGRVFLFLFTDDFWRDYKKMIERGIKFVRPPKLEEYGQVAVFEDLYGNLWDLIESDKSTDKKF